MTVRCANCGRRCASLLRHRACPCHPRFPHWPKQSRWLGVGERRPVMDIVDAQVHVNRLVADWQTADPESVLQAAITAMDAVGIGAVLIAESRGYDAQMRPNLGTVLP